MLTIIKQNRCNKITIANIWGTCTTGMDYYWKRLEMVSVSEFVLQYDYTWLMTLRQTRGGQTLQPIEVLQSQLPLKCRTLQNLSDFGSKQIKRLRTYTLMNQWMLSANRKGVCWKVSLIRPKRQKQSRRLHRSSVSPPCVCPHPA